MSVDPHKRLSDCFSAEVSEAVVPCRGAPVDG